MKEENEGGEGIRITRKVGEGKKDVEKSLDRGGGKKRAFD